MRFPFELILCRCTSELPPRALFWYIPRTINPGGHRCPSNCLYLTYAHSGRNVSREVCSTFAVRASKQGTYWNRYLHRRQPHPLARCSPPQCHPFYVQIARKERIPVPPSRQTGIRQPTLICWTQEIPNGQPNTSISCENQTF